MRTGFGLAAHGIIAAVLATSGAHAQDLVMRRPLPKDVVTGPGSETPAPSPDTPPTNPKPTPGVVEPINPVDDPVKTVCDSASSADAKVTAVQWVEAGWTAPSSTSASCTSQTMRYVCQATYSCKSGGVDRTFSSEAPDSTCENFDGQVTSAPASYPTNADVDAQAKWVAGKMAQIAAMNPTSPTQERPTPYGTFALQPASNWVRIDTVGFYNSWYTNGWALRVYFNDYPWGPFCAAYQKYSGKRCDNYGPIGTWVAYK